MATGYAVAEDVAIPSSLLKKEKIKKPGFIKRWLLNQIKDAVEAERENEMIGSKAIAIGPSNRIDSDKGIRFNVYKATGGTIIETTFYDRRTDRHHNALHVITEDKDIGKELGKIITMESLKT